jgi:AraC family transcriptional regulator of arabinose operon
MAQKLAISSSALQTSYKEAFGTTCIADVIAARIDAAKRLLTDTELSVNQISEISGYQSYEHFIRQFKSMEGVTPLVFRKKMMR